LPSNLLADGHDHGFICHQAVFLLNGAKGAFPARLAHQLAQDAVVNTIPGRKLAAGGLG
jgi:hypothetical protein